VARRWRTCHTLPGVPALALAALLLVLGCRRPQPAAEQRAAQPVGIRVAGWSAAECAGARVDADRDGLDDGCELALAAAFAPELVLDARDCSWTSASGRLAGGYLFVAQPTEGAVRVAYLPAYFRDCGWSGPVCLLRGAGCAAHAGDSEMIAVELAPSGAAGSWRTTGVFLSAHCYGRSAGRCRWYRGPGLEAFRWAADVPFGAPRVWVARGKHAHYPTRASCDRGHWSYDTCDGNDTAVRFPIESARQNVGSRARPRHGPGGCVFAGELPLGAAGADASARECIWDPARPFRGWQPDQAGTPPTSYARYLGEIGM
jgi:hypothetical protein